MENFKENLNNVAINPVRDSAIENLSNYNLNYKPVNTGHFEWIEDTEGNTVYFKTADSLVDSICALDKQRAKPTNEDAKEHLYKFKNTIDLLLKTFKSLDESVQFMWSDMQFMWSDGFMGKFLDYNMEEIDSLYKQIYGTWAYLSDIFGEYTRHCIRMGIHYDEIVKPRLISGALEGLGMYGVYSHVYHDKAFDVDLGYFINLLSPEDKAQAIREIEESKAPLYDITKMPMCTKALVMTIQELLDFMNN